MAAPKKITSTVWSVLEDAFMLGLSNEEACLRAGITRQTLRNYFKEHPDKEERKELLKNNVKMHAKINIANKIIKQNDIELSKYYLEKKDKEFSTKVKVETEHTETQRIQFIDDIPEDKEELTDFSKERLAEE